MTRITKVVIAGLATVLLAIPKPASADDARPAARNYIVTYERSVDSVDRETNQQEDARGFNARMRFRRALKGFAARLTEAQVAALRSTPEVASVSPDEVVRATGAVPLAAGEPLPPSGVRRIGAATAATTRQRSDATVAVLDTGVDLSHPDLNASDGTNCMTPGDAAEDDHGHGTHVAGIIGAKNDGAGVVGVAPGARIYAVKVMNANGQGTHSQIICGLEWVAAHAAELKIRVANMSFGSRGPNDGQCGRVSGSALHAAVCRVSDAGVVPVASAGNDGVDIESERAAVPAAYPEVLTVTALSDTDGRPGAKRAAGCDSKEADDRVASFSNFASQPNGRAHTLAAPGVCIRSTWPGGEYATMTGTSQAAPHVAGIAALCFGEAGVSGPCAGLSGAEGTARIVSDAEALASQLRNEGFSADPFSPVASGAYYGFSARIAPDLLAPESSIDAGQVTGRTAAFSLASPDAGVRFECQVDGGKWAPCMRRFVATGLGNGVHRLRVRAIDAAGNADRSPALRSFRVRVGRSATGRGDKTSTSTRRRPSRKQA